MHHLVPRNDRPVLTPFQSTRGIERDNTAETDASGVHPRQTLRLDGQETVRGKDFNGNLPVRRGTVARAEVIVMPFKFFRVPQ